MAKNKMKLKVKPVKREKKQVVTYEPKDEIIEFLKVLIGVLAFLGICALLTFWMYKKGVFDKGYTAPAKEDVTISDEFISLGTIFTRTEKSYYVLFDNYKDSYTSDPYINSLLEKQSEKYYKVDLSKNENKKLISSESDPNAINDSELKINGLTLIKITNGKITKYLTNTDEIEELLSK